MVGVKDVGGEEHGEEEDDPGRAVESLPEALDLGAPRGVLHDDDLCVVFTDDLVGVADHESEDGTDSHEGDEGGISTIRHGTCFLVDVLGEGDLFCYLGKAEG